VKDPFQRKQERVFYCLHIFYWLYAAGLSDNLQGGITNTVKATVGLSALLDPLAQYQ
jgi:hypothetical protein